MPSTATALAGDVQETAMSSDEAAPLGHAIDAVFHAVPARTSTNPLLDVRADDRVIPVAAQLVTEAQETSVIIARLAPWGAGSLFVATALPFHVTSSGKRPNEPEAPGEAVANMPPAAQ